MAVTLSQSTAIASLPLPHFLKNALVDAGYRNISDLLGITAGDLCGELGIGVPQAEDILRHAENRNAAVANDTASLLENRGESQPVKAINSSTATDLLIAASRNRFGTFSPSLDQLISHFSPGPSKHAGTATIALGNPRTSTSRKGKEKERSLDSGHVCSGMAIEIAGPPGGGKTAIAIGLSLSARLSRGGDEEAIEVLVIDTEGAITPDRLKKAAISLTRNLAVSPTALLKGVHLVRIVTQVQMIAFLHTLDDWLEHHPKVHLVIFDTLSHHFRQPTLDMKLRSRIMELAKQSIGKATSVHSCAVVVTNQLATKLLTAENKPANFETGERAVLMPQPGELWTTSKTVRIVLFRGGPGDELRYAHASTIGEKKIIPWACFDIDSDGIPCDVPEVTKTAGANEESS